MALKIGLLAGTLLLLEAGLTAQTQVAAQPATSSSASTVATLPVSGSETSESPETVPRVPGVVNMFRGFNTGINYAGVHNSAIGWYSVLTPALSYAFSTHYSADVSSSIYFKRKYMTYSSGPSPSRKWVEEAADGGDTLFGFHGAFAPGPVENVASFTLSAPTGDPASGLGTGHVTYDFANHTEYFRKRLGMFADVGAGNSSVLFNNFVEKNYSTLGGLAHFMVGTEDWIGDRLYWESLMYEQLPFGTQKVFAQSSSQGGPPQRNTTTVISTGANEDNGITTYIGIPVLDEVTLSGYYSRSFRRHTDTVSFGFTWVLRGRRRDSLVNRALAEAEKTSLEN